MAILKRILKNKKIYLIMIVQLFLIMMLINLSASLIFTSNKKKVGLENLFNTKNSVIARVEPLGGFDGSDDPSKFIENVALKVEDNYVIFDELKTENLITNHYIYYPALFPVEALNETIKLHEKMPKKYKTMTEYDQFLYGSKILIDKNFIEKNKIKVKEGRPLNYNDTLIDYKTQNVPILLGSDFEGIFKVGDIINDIAWSTNEDCIDYTLEVVGIMEDFEIPATTNHEEFFASSVIYGNAFSVIPTINNFVDISRGMAVADSGVILELNAGVSNSKLKEALNKKLNHIGLEANLYDLGTVDLITQSFVRDAKASLTLGFILLILGCVGIVNILLASIVKRKKEFGVKISCGAEIQDIIKEFLAEVVLSCFIASSLAIFFSIGKNYNAYILIINIFIILFISLVTSILPIKRIKAFSIIDLIRESEE